MTKEQAKQLLREALDEPEKEKCIFCTLKGQIRQILKKFRKKRTSVSPPEKIGPNVISLKKSWRVNNAN